MVSTRNEWIKVIDTADVMVQSILKIRDVIGGAKRGSGKTLAFPLPAVMELLHVMCFPQSSVIGACRKTPYKLLIVLVSYLLIQEYQYMCFIVVCLVKL
jgi:superfamily II DNA/RNA helicase